MAGTFNSGRLALVVMGMVFPMAVVGSGCASSNRKDLVATHELVVETRAIPEAQFSKPSVILDNNILEVNGTVRMTTPLSDDGRHIHLDLFSHDVQELDLIEANLTPNPQNPNDKNSAAYSVRYYYNPPVPVTLMVVSLENAQCWNSMSGNEKAGSMVDWGNGGAKVKQLGSKAMKPEYNRTSTSQKPTGFHSPGYSHGRTSGRGQR